ncbi:MAG TPA: M48 family metallopeptidase [Gammaproteobacteria bacterium]|nr:M48 family metallopeptidase [Gammaproteobacteria bacterium]
MRRLIIGIAVCCLTAACQTVQTTRPGTVGVDREQQVLSFISEQDMQKSAAEAYAQQVQQAKAEGKLNTDAALLRRVKTISDRLIQQTTTFREDARSWPWEVNVLTSAALNAYVMPGGKIMVYSGLISALKLTDAEIAGVVGHEISHALREHARERVSSAYGQQLLLSLGGAVLGAGDSAIKLADAIAQVTFQLPHSREQESEADLIGLELMARAGYDPQAAITVWEKMTAANSSGQPPEFLSTHPSNESRIADLQAQLPKVVPLYQARR